MFKVGDKIRCIDFIEDMDEDNFSIDSIYVVVAIPFSNGVTVRNDNDERWQCNVNAFEKYKKYDSPPKNDIEWMDRVQENFSEEGD